ncbi:MAG: protocatechuate 3,4-dioxygenase subunit beta [Acidobacteriota bacterium]|nr:protocatechuate 3,4-dioxygenase subunit beta [Acidobacteriota bacterium]
MACYRRAEEGCQPELLHPPYASSVDRAPRNPPILIPQTLSEITGPPFGGQIVAGEIAAESGNYNQAQILDMTRSSGSLGEAIGQRIIVSGRLLDEDGRGVASSLIEIWQANAAGRYLHNMDQHDAPLDPNFTGVGQTMTDAEGKYRFATILPGKYPWRNHFNAWRPAHIHFSLFGPAMTTRLVTQMYFPGDPLLAFDPIFNSTSNEAARARLISSFDWESTIPESALGFHFDIVLRGRDETPMENK